MDLWDMTKLLFRRWRFFLPTLLLCGAVAFGATRSVAPDYVAVGHVTLIPPTGSTGPDGRDNPIRNPWYDLGYLALGNATVLDVTGRAAIEQLAAEGLSENVAVEMDEDTLFRIEVVADTPERATATVQRMMAMIAAAVADRQTLMRVASTDVIGTLALDDGTNVETKTSKIVRVMVVAIGVALLLSVASTIGFDAILRRRAARRAPGVDPDLSAAAGPPEPAPAPARPARARRPASATRAVAAGTATREGPAGTATRDVPTGTELPAPVGRDHDDLSMTTEIATGAPLPPDATVVLPLAGGVVRRGKRTDQR